MSASFSILACTVYQEIFEGSLVIEVYDNFIHLCVYIYIYIFAFLFVPQFLLCRSFMLIVLFH